MFLITLKILFLLAATAAAKSIKDEELPNLKWAKQYSFEATKSSLTSGLVEDISYWRTSKKCRIDYNKGAVKMIAEKGSRRGGHGVGYKIYPVTTEQYTNEMKCEKREGTPARLVKLIDVLPSTSDFTHVGKDILDAGEVQKFIYEEDDINDKSKKILWASLDKKSSSWIPVKLEEIEFNPWVGNLKSHYVWNIFNYKTEVDSEVFDVEKYNCDENKRDDISNIDVNNKLHVELAFKKYKDTHNKQYKDEDEHEMRRKIFEKNLRLIQEHNRKNNSYILGINKFSDQTPEEMQRRKGLIRRKAGEVGNVPFPYTTSKIAEISETLPKQYDLRLFGIISPVGDQEDCGSCWTFGTTAAVEGALARNNGGRLLRLANQALIDCAWGFGVAGCEGGSDTAAYRWMMEYGLPTVEEYGPYRNKDGFCEIENMTQTYRIKGFTDVTPFSVEALKVALVNHGPLSVSIHATDVLKMYTGGILYDPSCDPSSLNHEVTLVGYGEQDGDSYWIVRNSWGTNWGIDGYFHISTRDNSCGIATEPTYVVF
ncbi:unnamed protein product [Euphydryas editha]|uniref:Uncharacterized protein n=1 Tax=Euphydryas editha TaxID=104508 RepID=A0AAU9THW8_EUPED|nr:unnamed protein product [Euphydryas editha]